MSVATLHEHELEVERAREKLAGDLTILRSPSTFAAFKEDVKHEALAAKDALVKNAKSTVQSATNELLQDLKAKAAANPAATLAIGAGIAWRLIHRPPIATALIGAGLFSLWRTPAQRAQEGEEPGYLLQGKERLKEQASELASSTKEVAADVGQAITATAADLVDAAKETVQQCGDNVRETTGGPESTLESGFVEEASLATRALADQARRATANAFARTDQLIHETVSGVVNDQQSRDKLLLGVAGVAVAVALGMAYQRRSAAYAEVDRDPYANDF